MTNLNKSQRIAVAVALVLIGYVFFYDTIVGFFLPNNSNQTMESQSVTYVVEDISLGSGALVESGQVLSVHYVGTLSGGEVFDSSRARNTPFEFTIGSGEVIRGWDEGLIGMRVGGTRRLIIGPDYAYGARQVGPIPPNSTLIFEVEVLDAN